MSKTASGFFGVTWADGTVGAPAFSDGVVIADYSRRRIIIEQAAELRRREFDASGMNFRAIAPDFESVEVSHVVAGSPADVVGVRSGDRLVAVDGVRVDGAGLDRVCQRLRKDGTRVTIEVERRGSELTFELLLVALL
jgi:C-terminal processing protease CtpA/Prc